KKIQLLPSHDQPGGSGYAGPSTRLRLGGAPSRSFGSTIPDRNAPPTPIAMAIDQNMPRMMIFFCESAVHQVSAAKNSRRVVDRSHCPRNRARSGAGRGAAPIIYLDGSRHAGRKDDARRHLIDMHANRNALRETYPSEDRVDRR